MNIEKFKEYQDHRMRLSEQLREKLGDDYQEYHDVDYDASRLDGDFTISQLYKIINTMESLQIIHESLIKE